MRKATLDDIRKELSLRLSAPAGWRMTRDSGEIGWKDSEGKIHELKEMNDVHIANLYAYLLRKSYEAGSSVGGACAESSEETPFDDAFLQKLESSIVKW